MSCHHYSGRAAANHQDTQENFPDLVRLGCAVVAKKVNRARVKSPYRDALFRPLFQAVAALEDARSRGETSVIWHTPSHPLFPILRLPTSILTTTPTLTVERLTDEEEIAAARFWKTYYVETPRKHRTPARWRDLSDEARLEWFHYAMRASGPIASFTLNLDDKTEAQVSAAQSSAGWLSKRIARNLKQALGRHVPFWFVFEVTGDGRLHVHGELGASCDELPAARKALRRAGGEWADTRQHQAHTRENPSAIWSFYSSKNAIFMRRKKGRFQNLPRPINGDWKFATNDVRHRAGELYEGQLQKALEALAFLDI